MKTILVATDFSESSKSAALYATLFARELHASIRLLHVNIPVESFNQSPVILKTEKAITNAETQLEALRSDMQAHGQGEVEIETHLRIGEFFTEMYHYCEEIKPYAVIMGSQGSTATERFLMGSNSVHAMKNLPWPLITVPAGTIYTSIKKIALASDFEDVVETLPLDSIKVFLQDFEASLDVINVGQDKEFNPEMIFESGLMQELFVERKPRYHFITRSNTEEGIMDFCEANEINLLIVIPKQYGFLEGLFHKSLSKQLVLRSNVPVMALRANLE